MGETRYTLRELAKWLGVSQGLIYKIETIFGLRRWSSQLSGKKSLYSQAQANFFLKVIFMRSLGFSLPDIKALYEAEKRINSFVNSHFRVEYETTEEMKQRILRGKRSNIRYIPIFLIADVECDGDEIEYDRARFEQEPENAAKLKRLCKEHHELYQVAAMEAEKRQQEMAKRQRQLKTLATFKLE